MAACLRDTSCKSSEFVESVLSLEVSGKYSVPELSNSSISPSLSEWAVERPKINYYLEIVEIHIYKKLFRIKICSLFTQGLYRVAVFSLLSIGISETVRDMKVQL